MTRHGMGPTKGSFKKGSTPWNKGTGNGRALYKRVMEQKIGRAMKPGEVVHHIDSNRANNLAENLQLFSSHSEHMKHHSDSKTMSARGKKGAEVRWANNKKAALKACGIQQKRSLDKTKIYR